MNTQWNDHTLNDILFDVQRLTRERGEAEAESDTPIPPPHRWTLHEVDQLLGLESAETGISDYELPDEAFNRPRVFTPGGISLPDLPGQTADAKEPKPEAAESELKTEASTAPAEPEQDAEEPQAPSEPEPTEETPDASEDTAYPEPQAVEPTESPEADESEDVPPADEPSEPEEPTREAKTAVVPPIPEKSAEPADTAKTKIIGKIAAHIKPAKQQPKKPVLDPEMVDGQMILQGFDTEETVEQLDEKQAEHDLRQRRKAQIKDFKLYDFAKKYEPDLPPKSDIFEPEPEPGDLSANSDTIVEDEYLRLSDRMRIGRLLQGNRRRAFLSSCAVTILFTVSIILSAVSGNSLPERQQIFSAVNLVLLSLSVAASIPTFFAGMQNLFRRKPTCGSAAFITVIAAIVQGIVAFILPGTSSMGGTFCTAAIFTILLGQIAALSESIGTLGNFKFCAFTAAENLHTVRDFEFSADAFAIGKTLETTHPKLRYTQKTGFPARFRQHAAFRSILDKLCRILLPAAFVAALIMAVTGWITTKTALGALSAFTEALCVAMPCGAALTVTAPLVQLMQKLNRRGGMVVSPEAAAANSGLSAVCMDSTDLYDPEHTEIFCYQDFGAIRIDDVFLYAAALAVGAHTPAESAFLHTVGNPDILPPVRSLIYEERLGISAYIRNQSVLLGSRNLLSNHSIDPPPKSAEVPYLQKGKRVLYLAVDSKVCAMVVLTYAEKKSLSTPLQVLQNNDTRLLVYAPDCNLTEEFIASGFGLRKGEVHLISPAAGELLRTRLQEESDSAPAAATHNGTTEGMLHTLASAAVMQNIQRVAAFIAVIGCGIGWLVSFILLLVKGIATVNWMFAVLYPAVWIIASLMLGTLQARKALK